MALERLLVATDFSPRAGHAVERAAALARGGASLNLLHVLPLPGEGFAALGPTTALTLQRELATEAEAHLATVAEELRTRCGVACTAEVRVGTAFHEIIRHADEVAADLVVLGAQGGHFIGDLVLGTTAEKVVRKGHRPVLVVRRPDTLHYRSILIGVDFSADSGQAARFARQAFHDAAFHLMHAHDPWYLERLRSDIGSPGTERYLTGLKGELLQRLHGFATAQGLPSERCTYTVVFGYPGVEITNASKTAGADLVVVGSRGSSGLAEVLLGSTSEHVLREADCDVLVVR